MTNVQLVQPRAIQLQRPRANNHHALLRLLQVAVPAMLLTALFISMQPFGAQSAVQAVPDPAQTGAINRIGYSLLGVLAIAGMTMIASPRRISAAMDFAWIAAIILLAVSAIPAPDTFNALKSLAFTLVTVIVCVAILAIPRDERHLRTVFLIAVGTALAVSYFGVLIRPDLAIHSGDGVEAQHAGLWRGHFSHKNIAGPVMAVYVFFGVYFLRAGNRVAGSIIIMLSAIFVINTGSKTTIGFTPVVITIVLAGTALGLRWLTVIAGLLALATITALTIGTVVWQPLAELSATLLSDPTYTGRTTLWAFGLENISEQFWTGYGYDGFWLKPAVLTSDLPFDAEWDYREIVHGHNNYIDIMLAAGVPAGIFIMAVLCLLPMAHYLHGRTSPENRRLADLFMMIVLFAMLNSHLESFWFRRADAIWVLLVIGVFGLRMTARLPFTPERRYGSRDQRQPG